MRLRWERGSRLPRVPLWAVALVGVWLLLVLGGVLLERWQGAPLETCLLHRVSGRPCPTCGSTRVVLAFLQGRWGAAFGWNPFVAVGLAGGTALLALRLASGWRPVLEANPWERNLLLAGGVGLLLANWVWVLRTQP